MILLIVISFFLHDFHFSRLEMNYNEDEKILESTLHVFIDDLELALGQITTDSLFLGTKKESNLADSRIQEYIIEHLHLSNSEQGDPMNLTWVGKEQSDDLTAYYIHFYYEWDGSALYAKDRLLMELFDDQKNLIYLKNGSNEKHVLFNHRDNQKQLW